MLIMLISSQFRTFNLVADCLFSLINGDEVYSSFKKLRDKTYVVWLFSRIYIYSFISLFTFMVLSLFIAIITDTYETIRVSVFKLRSATLRVKLDVSRMYCVWCDGLCKPVTTVLWFCGELFMLTH